MSITLITGGCGFIGGALARTVLARFKEGDRLILIDSLQRHGQSPELQALWDHPAVTFHRLDLADPAALSRLDYPLDRLYHIAALIGVERASTQPLHLLKTNTLSTMNVFEWFQRQRTENARLLFASSSEVYAGGIDLGFDIPIPTPETVPMVIADIKNPRLSYALSKIWGEAFLNYLAGEERITAASVRYHNVYGPSMGFDHVIPQVVNRVMANENPFRMIGCDQTRSFCWVEDAAEATYRVMESQGLEPGMAVHIGNPAGEVTIGRLYKEIFKACGRTPANTIVEPAPVGSVKRRCPDTRTLEKLVGEYRWTSLEKGLKKTVAWYMNRNSHYMEEKNEQDFYT